MVLVTGATGRVGTDLVRILRQAGFPTRCLVRKGSEYYRLNDLGADFFFGDLRDPSTLRRACRGQRYLVACSGVHIETRANNHENVTVRGHEALWDAALDEGIQRVVFLSCMSNEATAGPSRTRARTSRDLAEESLRRSGLDYVVLRPSIYTEVIACMANRATSSGRMLLPGRGSALCSPISTRDVALHAMASLDLDSVRNRAIPLGGPQTMTLAEALNQAMELARGTGARLLPIPAPGLALARGFARLLSPGWASHLQEWQALLGHDNSVDPSTFTGLFHLPLTPFQQAVKAALDQPCRRKVAR